MFTRSDTPWERPTAVLFDLDGTLYDQRILRRAMLGELARAPLTKGPLAALRIAKALRSFRLLREDLREDQASDAVLAQLQYDRPAAALKIPAGKVESIVTEWMYEKPLRHLRKAAWPHLRETLMQLRNAGLRLGVFSDYPPAAKLGALGVADLFEVTLGATDSGVNAFKPNPKGFAAGARALGVTADDVVYVGDRHDVDGQGAAAAGMRCVVLETGLAHVGAGEVSAAARPSPGQLPDQPQGRLRSITSFSEVPRAVGIA